ncbi:MAG TPA: glycoside hydrolase family 3 N-terminal domain-containing protein [Chryseosolibacter sp.]
MKSISRFIAALSLTSVALSGYAQQDSLGIKIGQMIEIGFPKAEVDPKVLEEVRQGKVGAVIIFEKNIPATNSFNGLKKITWTYQNAAQIPLLISIDQEGGRVNRLKAKYGFPASITAEAMGKSKLDSVRFYSESTAATLAGLGININFAPVVDLAINRDNPIIAKVGRSFSANEDSVVMMAKEVVKAHRKYGVLTSLKHFPGHGSSKDDTHKGLTDVTNTWQDRELKPYQALIDSGYVDGVMTSHIVHRTLEPDGHPGTLSDDILTGILRNKLHFDGVVFSDDMQMHAITKHYSLEDAIRMAINAGVDVMTFSNNIAGSDERTSDKVHAIIRKMVENGQIKPERIDESFKRIMRMKRKLVSKDVAASYNQQILSLQKELDAANQTLTEYKDVIEKARKKKEKRNRKKK